MEKETKKYREWTRIPPWVLMGAMAVLLPILAFTTFENINRQKKHGQRLLMEKGAALIRSFEAGTRFGMMGMMGGGFQLQRLLMETARQPDIDYLLVTDIRGKVLAHSDPEKIGTRHGRNLDLVRVAGGKRLLWRLRPAGGSQNTFEVFGRFRPDAAPPGRGMGRMGHHRFSEESNARGMRPPAPGRIIFVGLNTAAVDAARTADTRHSLFMGVILLLAGVAGLALLFVAQSYRATRRSLSRIRSFSDQLVDNMPIGLVSLDTNLNVAAINPAGKSALKKAGLDPDHTRGKTVLPPEIWQMVESLDNPAGSVEKEIDCRIGQGASVPLGVSASAWHDEYGHRLGHILLIRDLTEVHALRKEIARSQRLASVGSLAAGVAHEIRNPLSSIKGFATYFKERYRNEKDLETAIIMIREVDRLNRVVGQLLELARPVAIASRPTRIAGLIDATLALVRSPASKKGITIDWHPPAPSPEIRIDADRIQQVLLNLFLNAMEAMGNDGVLTVALAVDPVLPDLVIRVCDTGSGITPEHQQQIFDPYFTTKSGGTGLGLAIVYNIVEAHQGKIDIQSRAGRGTEVAVRLPLIGEEADER